MPHNQHNAFARLFELFRLFLVILALFATTAASAQSPSQDQQPAVSETATTAPSNLPNAAPDNTEPQPTTPANVGTASGTILFPSPLRDDVTQQSAEVDRLAKAVDRVREDDAALDAIRPKLDELIARSNETSKALEPLLTKVERQITTLGEKPKDGEAPETSPVAAERERLTRARGEVQDAIKRSELTRVRAGQLIDRIQAQRLRNLGRDLKQRSVSPLNAVFWTDLWTTVPRFITQITTVTDNWWATANQRIHWLFLIGLGAIFIYGSLRSFARRTLSEWLRQPLPEDPPAYMQRVQMAVGALPLLLVPGLVAIGSVYFALLYAGLLNDQIDTVALSAIKALALFLVIDALARAVLLPSEPSWRLIGLPTSQARRYLWLIRLLAATYCLDIWLNDVFTALFVPLPLKIVQTFLANILFAILLFAFAWGPARSADDTESDRTSARLLQATIYWLRVPATLAVFAIVAVSLAGYFALGRFIAGQVMLIGVGAAALLLGHLAARSVSQQVDMSGKETFAARHLALTGQRRTITMNILAFILDVLFILIAISLLLMTWGYSHIELIGWGRSLLFGFEVGNFRFSLIQIVLAVILFAGLIILTRLFQRWLNRTVLTGDRVDRGIANSIHSGVGYLGVALAALIGVSYAGLDLSNIALIASALSIGIGFGLNAIASNFVSGLIMLIERPIKVGDWVVVGNFEGYVRHISVRATEIETFDRASVIIPNSDFMTSAVQNWTHRNAMGRVVVPVGVAYSSDLEQVIEILEKAAADCEPILSYPAPFVVLEAFGASSIDFTVRAYVADVTTRLRAKTALLLKIAKALREADIEIPFPQQDVHMRDLDGVRSLLAQAAARQATAANDTSAQTISDELPSQTGPGDDRGKT